MASSKTSRYRLMANLNTYSRTACSAYGCEMRSGTNALSEIKMYQFPKDPYRRRRWELATRRANWRASNKSRLCSTHFITGKPSKDPRHPDYVPSIFVFSNVENIKKSLKKLQKKSKASVFESSENSTNDDTQEGACTASSCGKAFCSSCSSPESVSSAFNKSLAPLNETLSQLMAKLKDMEEERELLHNELAHCREEIYELREAHQHCKIKSQSKRRRTKKNKPVAIPSSTSEDATEILESMYSVEPFDMDDPDSFPSLCLEQNSIQPSAIPNKGISQKEQSIAAHSDEVIGIIEQFPSPKKKRVKTSNLESVDTSESSRDGKSSDSSSPITIVYLKR